jgi:hypothetical protein
MKYIFIILSGFIFCCGCSGTVITSENSTINKHENKKEPVKELLNPEKVEREYIRKNKIKVIDKIQFNYTQDSTIGKPLKLSSARYDDKGLLVETINYNEEGTIENLFNYVYDSTNVRVQSKRFDSQNRLQKIFIYEYDKYGFKTKVIRTNLSGESEKYYQYIYDSNGNLIGEKWFDINGDEEYSIKYLTGNNNKKSEAFCYLNSGRLESQYTFRYDSKGNLVEELRYNEDGEKIALIQYVYKYE